MENGKDVFGNPTGENVQGNASDGNVWGKRPEDVQGNAPKDGWGDETGS